MRHGERGQNMEAYLSCRARYETKLRRAYETRSLGWGERAEAAKSDGIPDSEGTQLLLGKS